MTSSQVIPPWEFFSHGVPDGGDFVFKIIEIYHFGGKGSNRGTIFGEAVPLCRRDLFHSSVKLHRQIFSGLSLGEGVSCLRAGTKKIYIPKIVKSLLNEHLLGVKLKPGPINCLCSCSGAPSRFSLSNFMCLAEAGIRVGEGG